jgi:isocitrate dehydrogenase kinase/phosphatase
MSLSAEHPLTNTVCRAIIDGYRTYRTYFQAITARAMDRFVQADWAGMQADALERLEAYQRVLQEVVDALSADLGAYAADRELWAAARTAAAADFEGVSDPELAETFFNSVARRMANIIGVDARLEFLRPAARPLPVPDAGRDYRAFPVAGRSREALFSALLEASWFQPHFRDRQRDARRLARHVGPRWDKGPPSAAIARIEMLPAPFFRGMGAYLIGRAVTAAGALRPLALALINDETEGLVVDGLIDTTRGVRILFSYTHSYFHVLTERVSETIAFLQPLLPHRRLAELYISIGFNRHGKTELYRDLAQHQNACRDIFAISPGKPGMVMAVFNMPSDDLVFKVIRDRFAQPKRTTRREVMAKYAYVFRHDRTGRLPDTQSFDHLQFDRGCFHADLLNELQETAARAVTIGPRSVAIELAYVERRVRPLDLYLQEAPSGAARRAVIDFGQAIKDLAYSNLFPGDMLLKNFGVTGLGRVIFYDFDEICPLTACRFRRKPPPRGPEDELAAEPWYFVGKNDIFPEEFESFLGLSGELKAVFLDHHRDLLDVAFWRRTQEKIEGGDPLHAFPYERLKRGTPGAPP